MNIKKPNSAKMKKTHTNNRSFYGVLNYTILGKCEAARGT
jgi:hypothetical protein